MDDFSRKKHISGWWYPISGNIHMLIIILVVIFQQQTTQGLNLVGGIPTPLKWYTYPSEKYDFVSWDDDSQLNGNNNPNVPKHQPVFHHYCFYRY